MVFALIILFAFFNFLPKDPHVIRKKHTVFIEHDNSNTRDYLGRMTNRTKIVSKKEERGMAQSSFGRPLKRLRSSLMIKRHFYLCLGENSSLQNRVKLQHEFKS
jgi:hypothetical protein